MKYYHLETHKILEFVKHCGRKRILDVGCGQGRILNKLLIEKYDAWGVEISREQISSLGPISSRILHVSELNENLPKFDLIIFSHIIEHISPNELIAFFNQYSIYLNSEGYFLIATPLMHRGFYDDYDHIKPYNYIAIDSLLLNNINQIQSRINERFERTNIWFRKYPFSFSIYPDDRVLLIFIKKILNKTGLLIYHLSGKTISKRTGWLALYKLISR